MTTASADRRGIITEALRKIDDLSARLEIAEKGDTEPIAVVGLGCRLPGGVHDAEGFWEFLRDGGNGVVRVPAQRWDADAFYSPDYTVPGTICTRDGGFLTSWQPDEFDAEFFGLSPREAAAMDPQQRLLLEVAWEALENAGITSQGIRGTQTSVFVGMTTYDYSLSLAGRLRPDELDPHIPFGNASNFAAGRLSYFLGVHGPAVVIDTACSSSLVAVHLACQSLRRRESDHAIAAGVNLILSPENSIACSRWGMLAPDGRCKTFDASANGYVRSEGCGAVVLKRLSDALRDGDSVLAVVRGSAVNQDGPSSGQTVPSGPAQQALMRQTLAAARLKASDIDYIEAHGTGTALGDPIELEALSQVYSERGDSAPLVLGSVKTNLGHLESAAGIAGFIKTVLSVQHGYIPRHLHFEELTPRASEGATRFAIPAQGMEWPASGRVRRAGVSSFGVSGTNAHVLLEQAPLVDPVVDPVTGPVVDGAEPAVTTLVISGKTQARVASMAAMLADWMDGAGAGVRLADVAHAVNHHRTRHGKFASVTARDRGRAVAGLRALADGGSAPGAVGPHDGPCRPGTVFVYSGQGSQWPGMGAQLLTDEPVFAAAIDEMEPAFVEHAGFSLRQVLESGEPVVGIERIQPVLVGIQLALTALWRSYGVEPDAVIGHSMGEVAAAVVAGALTVAEGLQVISTRSRLMSRLAGQGAMALLELDAPSAEALIADYPDVTVAVYASPRQTVIAGPPQQVDAVIARVEADDRLARRIEVDVASHHPTIDPILPELRIALANLAPITPKIPLISTTGHGSGEADGDAPVVDADYWVANLRNPVRFSQAVAAAGTEHATFIEVSPHPLLTYAIADTLGDAHHHSLGTLQRDEHDTLTFHTNLNATHTVRPPATEHPKGSYPVLPATPWHHTRHWIDVDDRLGVAGSTPRRGTLLGDRVELATTPPAYLWQARLTPDVKPYPGSHRIRGVDVVPASVLLQTLSAAAEESGASTVSEVRFEYPIVVDQPRLIQVIADDESVTVSSSSASANQWVRHVRARIARGTPDVASQGGSGGGSGDAGAAPSDLDAASIAELQQAWGLEGQPFEWSITSCRSTPNALHAEVELPQASASTLAPALLDAAVHVARLVDISNDRLMFPAGVDSVTVGAEPGTGLGSVDVRRRDGAEGELVVDITITAPDGRTCFDIRALRYADAEAAPEQGTGRDDPGAMVHAIEWQPWDLGADAAAPAGTGHPCAVVGDVDAGLRDRLAAAGYPAVGVDQARYVLYVAAPAAVGDTDIDGAARLAAEVADLVARLAARDDANPATLWIVTSGVRDAATDTALQHSSLWGLAGVVGAEQPQLWGGLVDLPAGTDIAGHAPALASVLRTPAKSILSLRDGEFFAPALAPVSGTPVREPLRCRPDAAYLVTGGMGALGLLMADWLADKGARRLVLAGRSALPPRRDWDDDALAPELRRRIAAIRELETRGVTVEIAVLDIGSSEAVNALLARRDADGAAPIRGVIHAAGVTDSQLLTEIDESRLRATMGPKIAGGRALHDAFPPDSLDFLFLTASAGAVFGVPGQGAYAAGNAYLDGLARARHRAGGYTASLDWVAWHGLGFAAGADVVVQELERVGSRPVTPGEAFAAWEYLARHDVPQAVMVPKPSAGEPAPAAAELRSAAAWAQMSPSELRRELQTGLKAILARELRMAEGELESDRPFAELGLNSVMAMSVRRAAEQLVGVELSATMLWNHPTVESLAGYLATKLSPEEPEDVVNGTDPLADGEGSVLDELFDSVELASGGWDSGI